MVGGTGERVVVELAARVIREHRVLVGTCIPRPPDGFVREAADGIQYWTDLKQPVEVRDILRRRAIMTMLLGSGDLGRLGPLARQLVAAGIPIAVRRPSDISPCLEVWIQRDRDLALARGVLAGGMVPPAATQAPASAVAAGQPQRDQAGARGAAKMLLGSRDLLALELVAKRLVASGIPIAVCKATDRSSYVEVWIQRDCECSAGFGFIGTGVARGPARRGAVNRCGPGGAPGIGAGRRDISLFTSKFERCVGWLRQLG